MESATIQDKTTANTRKKRIYSRMRWMTRSDMPEVLRIEQESYEFPWMADDFTRCLRQRNCIGLVADYEDRIVGFIIYKLHKTYIRILNLAVDPAWRRCGVGMQIMAKLISKLSPQGQRRSKLFLEVRETNLPAQLFFKYCEFRAISILHNFFDDTPEDAYLMRYKSGSPEHERVTLLRLDPKYTPIIT